MTKSAQQITTDLFGNQIETKTPRTQDRPINTIVWAKWFKIDPVDEDVERMIVAASQWALSVEHEDRPRWLSLLGNSGVGKTHVARRLWDWLRTRPNWDNKADYSPQWIYWPQYIEELRDRGNYEKFRDMARWPFLVLDDVLAERQSDWSTEKLHNLLGARDKRWTIITSNKSAGEIAQVDVRIASRMARNGSKVVYLKSKDYSFRDK
ncbi:MAG: ATP-binding protein [Euryarchaeota archaeon]|nr:ATP-binding protein [Euryarchaeota archaeon]NDB94060.1 ATP-binding protein [Euryarchaeota archaeon]